MAKKQKDFMNQSAITRVISGLDECTSDELRQIYALLQVRLGAKGSSGANVPQTGLKPKENKRKSEPKAEAAKGKGKGKKGNPQRKSQWATNPAYLEYTRLKKTVANQAKELKCSFNLVDSTEKEAYDAAFSEWMKRKSSFRKSSETETSEKDEETQPSAGPSSEHGPSRTVREDASSSSGDESSSVAESASENGSTPRADGDFATPTRKSPRLSPQPAIRGKGKGKA
jgi:hypothetical protein